MYQKVHLTKPVQQVHYDFEETPFFLSKRKSIEMENKAQQPENYTESILLLISLCLY